MPGEFYIEGKKEKADLTEIQNNITQVENALTEVQNTLARGVSFLDNWSAPANKITISEVAADLAFPDIVVAALPSGLTIKKVVLVLSVRALVDISAADNYINGADKTLRIKNSSGAWGVDDMVGMTFPNQGLYCKASGKEAGPVIIGDTDLSALVNANGSYNVASRQTVSGDALVAFGASLELYDIQVGLRIFW
ncbi:MAG: hypothetical protein H8D49_03950 [Dehalococcoidia bacterium]|nr:hypothetical protein [Dehalococcoidia bacterium]